MRLHPKPVLELPILNTTGKALHGDFKLELLNTDDKVAATQTGTFDEKPGATLENVPWDVNQVDPTPSALGWLRLRYVFSPQAGLGVPAAEGILQLSRLIVGSFEVRMTAASTTRPGAKFPVRVRVDDPTSGKPLHGVHVKVSLDISDDNSDSDRTLNRDVVTDLSGYAVCTFDLPKDIQTDEAALKAVATRGVFENEADLTVRLPWRGKLTLSTDKPLYQPGQTVHVRVLVLDSDKQAMSGKNLIWRSGMKRAICSSIRTSRPLALAWQPRIWKYQTSFVSEITRSVSLSPIKIRTLTTRHRKLKLLFG